ncbi:uncharacterized protein SPPG_09454 [Spizellomyces punctatus DAOM BR117]|uniref:Uncharacterized protein n=1 Tax=Spizellomyces punctatus (strain DAOM BR117) TaxID=645134 RepID=A0A0L0H7S8_SPIPD|nr:uncharacterized protein SPPG_09454 [Spizellomyces punctatus DAOM BR117]KNC97282.1 hypothetical protein SPPG_09454 [Spizellomyces punctatus DAOM BR117]|eukprot:XP_016605322.1 hypothetical protein SPPG_09454 [Spizellomyces punctatus DAOM BR117]
MPLPNSIQGTYTVRRNLEVLDNFKSRKVKANSIYGESLRNKDGIVTILDLDSQTPSLSIQKNKGKYTISLAETTYVFPLIDDEHDVRLVTDDTLLITEDGLSVKPETLLQPLYRAPDSRTVSLNIDDDELKVEDEKLTVIPYNYDFPLYRDAESCTVGLQADDTLLITENGLSVNFPDPETLKKPLYRDQSGLGIKLHKSLKVNNNDELETNIQSVLKAFGALKSSSGADTLLDIGSSWLDFGFDSLTEMTDVLGEVDTTAIRLMVDSSTFSQAGSRLSLKSPGYEQIMYGNLTYGYSGSSSFTYSSTLQELRVPNVKLSGTLPAIGGGSYAVSKDYLSQFYQGSQTGAIAVGPEFSGRREIGVLVDNQTVRVVGNQLTGGYIFQDFNGVAVRPGTTNDIMLSLKCEAGSCLQMVKADTIKDVLTCSNGIERVQNDLQLDLKVDANSGLAMVNRGTIRDIFTASQGVTRMGNDFRLSLTAQSPDLTLNNGVLSSNIAAGIGLQKNGAILSTNLRGINGVQVSGDLISCSISGSDTILRVGNSLRGNYVGSTNSYGSIIVVGNTIQYNMIPPQFVSNSPNLIITGSYPLYNFTLIDPTPLSKQRDTDNTEQTDTAEVLKTDVPGGNVVVLSGLTPLTAIPFPAMVSPPLTVPMAVNSILPIVSTFPWGMIFGGSRKHPVTFMPPLEPGSNIAIASDPIGGCTRLLFDTPSCYRGIKYEYPQQAINLSMLRDYDNDVIKPWVGSQITNLTSNNVTFGGNISGKVITGSRVQTTASVAGGSSVFISNSFDGTKSSWLGLDGSGFLGYASDAATWLGAQDKPIYIYGRTSSAVSLGLRVDTNGSCLVGSDLTVGASSVNGLRALTVSNASTGTNGCSILYLTASGGSGVMFLNGNNRSVDGGINAMTLRNDIGNLRLQAQTARGLTILANTGIVTLDATNDASSTTTGALQVAGGLGVQGTVYMGKYAIISTTAAAAFQINNGSFGYTATAGQWVTNSVAGDYIIRASASNLRIGTNNATASNLDILSSGNVIINMTTDATSSTSGSFQVKGGVGIAKSLYVGGDVYTNGVKVATESFVTTGYQPLITPASSLNLSGLTVQNSNTNASAITLGNTSAAQTWNIHVAGSANSNLLTGTLGFYSSLQDKGYVFQIDPSGNTVMSGGLGVSTDAYIGGMAYIGGIEVATQKFVIDNTAPISQSLSSLTTTVNNNNNTVTTALASKQTMNSATNSIYSMTVQPDSWLYSSAGTTFENVTSTQVKGILDIATNANVNTLLSGKQNNITTSTNLSLASVTASGYVTVINGANPTYMSLVNTSSNITWGLRVAGSTADGSNPAGGFGINCSYNNIGYVFKISNTGITQITNTSQSTSSTTGALLVSGGLGVAKDLYAGGNVISSTSVDAPNWVQSRNVSSGVNAYSAVGCANDSGNGALLFLNSSTRTADGSSNNATLRNDCGDMNIQGKSGLGLGLRIVSISNEVKVLTATDSSSVTSGALQVSGGVGIAKTLWVGNKVTSGKGTGYGFGWGSIGGNVNTGDMTFFSPSSNGQAFFNDQINDVCLWAWNTNLRFGVTNSSSQLDILSSGNVVINTTTDASSSITGAFQVRGGVGISKNLYCGGSLYSNNLKVATESYVGAAIASKQTSSPLLDSISGVTLSANSFILGSSATTFAVKTPEEVKTILGITNVDLSVKQNASPLLSTLAAMSPMSNMFLMGDDVQGFTLANDIAVRSILNIVDYAPSISALQTSKQDLLTPTSNLSVNTILANDTSEATTVSSGALQVKGGIGVSKSIFSGGNITGKVLIAASTGGYFKLRSDTPSTKGDYTISYNNSRDALHVHLASSSDSVDQRRYEFGHYSSDTFGTWNSRFSVNTYTGDLISSGNLTIGLPLNGLRAIILKNLDSGSNSCAIQYFQNAAGSAVMFLNGNNRSVDGGQNAMTLRNDIGNLRLQAQTAKGLMIQANTGNVTIDSTTPALSSSTGALVISGGVAVAAHVVAGGNLYSNGAVYSNGQVCATQPWVASQTFLRNVQVIKLLTKDVWQSNNASKVFYVSTPGKVLMEWTLNLHGTANSNGTLSIFLGQSAGSMPLVYSSDFNFNSGVNRTITAAFVVTGMSDNVAYFTNFSISQAAPDNTTDVTLIKITELGQ